MEIDPPQTQLQTSVIFTNSQSATSAVAGLYSQMLQSPLNFFNGGITIHAGLSADEFYNTSPNSAYDAFFTNALVADNGTGIYMRLWKPAYQYIYQANAILEGLRKSSVLTDSVKSQLTGEMLVARSLCYFYLVNLYGDVPLILSTDYRMNAIMPRTSTSLVYDQMISDLKTAQNLLSYNYITTGRVRPNRWTATALLARIYLYKREWGNAESQADSIINSGQYALVSNLNNVFLTTSSEVIWQLLPTSTTINTGEGNTFIPASATTIPLFALTSFLLNAFETNDQRKAAWLKSNIVNGTTYYYPYKYKVKSGSTITENYIVFRLAEQYLIRAEARAQQNNNTGAQEDLNLIRKRAGLLGTNVSDPSSLLLAIEHERQIELFAEWGHRWLDLKRTSRVNAVLGTEKASNWQPTDALYPLPLETVQNNPYIIQNPGY